MSEIKNRKQKKIFTKRMQKKLAVLFIIIMLALIGLNARLTYINVESGEQYTKRVLSQQDYDSRMIPYRRGDIVDRNGTVLATSEKVYNVILDCKVVNTKEDYIEPTLQALVSCFDLDESELRTTLSEKSESAYVVLLKQQTYEEIQDFVAIQDDSKSNPYVKGVWFEEEYKRSYPQDSLASHVIGFTVSGNVGNWGIEQYYSDDLNGTNGRKYGYLNSDEDLEVNIVEPTNGYTIVSTIDTYIQQVVENHIASFNEQYSGNYREDEDGSTQTAVIVADPNTGEILAMANKDEFDLNNPRDLTGYYTEDEINAMDDDTKIEKLTEIWKNYALSTVYEPGSTAKPFTIAAGLDSGKLTGDETYDCEGSLEVAGTLIHCNKRAGHGVQTITEALMNSCNVALMHMGEQIGVDVFSKYQSIFNLGMKTGIDLPGEEAGILYSADNMGTIDLATNAFGQNFNVTMVQMVAAFSSVINGGYYYRPHVVSEILDENKAVVSTNDPIVLHQTISKEASDELKEMLYEVVADGTGENAQIAGYAIGGKTGTAEKADRDKTNYLVSFIGFAPVDDPQVVVYAVIDEPNAETQSSSKFASGLVRDIMEEILPYLNIYPEDTTDTEGEDSSESGSEATDTQTEADEDTAVSEVVENAESEENTDTSVTTEEDSTQTDVSEEDTTD